MKQRCNQNLANNTVHYHHNYLETRNNFVNAVNYDPRPNLINPQPSINKPNFAPQPKYPQQFSIPSTI